METYLRTSEPHMQVAVGVGFSALECTVKSRAKKMKEEIKNRFDSISPRSMIEQPSLREGTMGDHNTQRDTNSTVKVFTAASEYEASEGSAENASIYSLPDSLSSKSSLHDLLGLTEEFAAVLVEDVELNIQYQSLRQTFEFSEFKSELHRLLKVFSQDLSKETSIPIERASVRFINRRRGRISHAVTQEVFGLKEKSLFNENTKQQQLDVKERVEQCLIDTAQSKGVYEEQSAAGQEQNSRKRHLRRRRRVGKLP